MWYLNAVWVWPSLCFIAMSIYDRTLEIGLSIAKLLNFTLLNYSPFTWMLFPCLLYRMLHWFKGWTKTQETWVRPDIPEKFIFRARKQLPYLLFVSQPSSQSLNLKFLFRYHIDSYWWSLSLMDLSNPTVLKLFQTHSLIIYGSCGLAESQHYIFTSSEQ